MNNDKIFWMSDAPTRLRPKLGEDEKALLRRFLKGDITFAQLEGVRPEEALSLAETGYEFFQSSRLEEARIIFEGLAALNHLDPYPRQVLGAICEQEDRLEEALSHYDVSLSLRKNNPWALARRGEIKLKAGDVSGGSKDLVKACELDPENRLLTTIRAQDLLADLVDAARRSHN